MLRLFPTLLLAACGTDLTEDPVGPDLDAAAQDVEDALDAADPEPLLALLMGTDMPTMAGCPTVDRVEEPEGTREIWTGGCFQPDGTFVDGRLERFEGLDGTWVSGEAFALVRDGQTALFLDGAIELKGDGDIWLIDATATTCSNLGRSCEVGTVSVDLALTVFPAETYPTVYDVTVSGVVTTETSPILVDGAWRIDRTACGIEPMDGMVAIQHGTHQTLQLDGANTCDACAEWVLQGRPAPAYCATSF